MPIGTPVGVSGNSGSGTGSTASLSLPSFTDDGVALCFISVNSGTSPATPSGFAADSNNPIAPNAGLNGHLFSRSVTSAQSGASVSSALGGTRRWTMTAVYVPLAVLAGAVVATFSSTTASNQAVHPAIVPPDDDCMLIAFGVGRNGTNTNTGSYAPPAGYTEVADSSTSAATTPLYTAWADYRQLTGQNGISQTAVNGTTTFTGMTTDTRTSVIVALVPAATAVTGTFASTLDDATLAATGMETFTGTLAATLDDSTLSALGSQTVQGPFASTLDDAVLAATGTVGAPDVTGDFAATLDGASLAAAGSEAVLGSLAATLDGATLAGSGTETLTGALATALAGATLDATGLQTVTGAMSVALDGASLAASAQQTMAGILATTLDGAVLDAAGTVGDAAQIPLSFRLSLDPDPFRIELEPDPFAASLNADGFAVTLDPDPWSVTL